MTKISKIIALFFILVTLMFPIQSYAESFSMDSIMKQGNDWLKNGSKAEISEDKITNVMLPIGQFLMGIAVIVLVTCTIIMGIKYVTSDPNSKGKLKQQLIGLVVSGLVIFGAYGIWNIVYNFMASVTGQS